MVVFLLYLLRLIPCEALGFCILMGFKPMVLVVWYAIVVLVIVYLRRMPSRIFIKFFLVLPSCFLEFSPCLFALTSLFCK